MPTGDKTGGDSQIENDDVATGTENGKSPPQQDPKLSAREQMLADMDDRIAEQRQRDDEEFLRGADPRAIALAAEMGRESRGEPNSFDRGAAGRNAPAGEEAEPRAQDARRAQADRVERTEADPLADYIDVSTGQPMFKATIDGQVRLIPLEQARSQLQKHQAADVRLQEAANRRKELDARDAKLRSDETAFRSRAAQPAAQVDDATLQTESLELVRSLVSDPEPVAAKKLAVVLGRMRATQPHVDPTAIASLAVAEAKREIAADNTAKALSTGFQQFEKDYQDILTDPNLYALADRRTDAIAAEHPEWSPGAVMMEAGRLTREWVATISGKPVTAPKTTGQPNVRQAVKQRLTPMPQSRSARPAAEPDANDPESPQETMAQIRKARGQAY